MFKNLAVLLFLLTAFLPCFAQNPADSIQKTAIFKGQSSTPGNPSTGFYRMFFDNSGNLKVVNPGGSVTTYGGGFQLQTQTGFTNNNNPAIWLKGPVSNTTNFLDFYDSDDNQLVSVGYLGDIYAQRFNSADGNFFASGNSLYLKPGNGSYGIEIPRTGGIKFGPNYNGSSATDPFAWLDFTDIVEFGNLATGEKNLFWKNPALTYTWDTGAITNQRFFRLTAPTMAFDGASTVTNAATLAISGAPVAGVNATLTNSYGLWVESGVSRFDGAISLAGNTIATGANSIYIGSPATPVTSYYIGKGYSTNSPVGVDLQPSIPTGLDKTGADLILKAGASTGDGDPGSILLQASNIGSSGSSLSTQSTIATINYGGLQLNAGRLLVPQIKGTSSTPGIAAGAGAGTGASVSLKTNSNDTAGEFTLLTGTTPTADETVLTITFASAAFNAPFPSVAPTNDNAASLLSGQEDGAPNFYYETTTTTMVVKVNGTLPEATTYKVAYHLIQ